MGSAHLPQLLGRLLALIVRMQYETMGSFRLAADHYATALHAPGTVLPYLYRAARFYCNRASRDPQRIEATQWCFREIERVRHEIMQLGGCPLSLSQEQQDAFQSGFSSQWSVRPPGTRERVRRLPQTASDAPSAPEVLEVAMVPAFVQRTSPAPADLPFDPMLLDEIMGPVRHAAGLH